MKMEDFSPTKSENKDKLAREMENLALLQESLAKSDTMTQSMLGILSSFENRLSKLEETIIPIYQETGNLQKLHENIEKTLQSVDHVASYYQSSKEVEPIIADGPEADLPKYLECMEKLSKAVKYFEKHSPGSAEMSQVTLLYEAGKEALERLFKTKLAKHCKPVPHIIILDLLAAEEGPEDNQSIHSGETHTGTIEQFPEKVHKELATLANWLNHCGLESNHMQVYSKYRSENVVKTLHNLKDHLKTGSRDSSQLNFSSPGGPKLKGIKETPTKKAALKRMAFVKKASGTLKSSMAKLEAAGIVKGTTSGEGKEEVSHVDIDAYITEVSALLKLIQSEASTMQGIIPDKNQRKVFDLLVIAGLDVIVKEGEVISANIKRCITKQQHTAVISIFPVLKHLRTIKPQFDRILEGCQLTTKNKLAGLISALDATGGKALEEFIDGIRNDPDKSSNMPPDGIVHELTSNTVIFLEQLLDYEYTAGAMLLTQEPNSLPNLSHLDRPKLKLAEFITRVLSALGFNLSNKSETYQDDTLKAIFMLNNYNYILKSLRRSGLLELIHCWNNEVEKFFDDKILEQKRNYSTSWTIVLTHLVEKGPNVVQAGGKIKDKDRQLIKDRFVGFNKSMEEIFRIQKGYAIPDSELRDSLTRDNLEYILPTYKAFLQRYRNTNFSKNPEKYIKYSEREVANFIEKFFDSAA